MEIYENEPTDVEEFRQLHRLRLEEGDTVVGMVAGAYREELPHGPIMVCVFRDFGPQGEVRIPLIDPDLLDAFDHSSPQLNDLIQIDHRAPADGHRYAVTILWSPDKKTLARMAAATGQELKELIREALRDVPRVRPVSTRHAAARTSTGSKEGSE